ncbi:hypothetical protein BDF14DRAFT_1758224 [Spinellus fusiger]|nr:hypothetical protein BDF14DRAFT_1758224 [Spinellus fusiger]
MNKSFSHYTTRLADSKDHSLDEQTKERMAREWIEAALHHELPTLDLYTSLRDGVILCKSVK